MTKNCNFLDFLEILSQSLETHLSYHITSKWVVLAPKTSAICLTVKRKLLQKFVYQLFYGIAIMQNQEFLRLINSNQNGISQTDLVQKQLILFER